MAATDRPDQTNTFIEDLPPDLQYLEPGGVYELKTIKTSIDMRDSAERDLSRESSEESQVFEEVSYPPKAAMSLSLEPAPDLIARQPPLTFDVFKTFFDSDGRLLQEHRLRQAVFKGGVDKSVRKDVWRFLFGLYPFDSTAREREILLAEHHLRYRELKKRWNTELRNGDATAKYLHPGYLDPMLDDSYDEDLEQHIDDMRHAESQEHDSLVLPDLPSPDIRQQLAFMELQAKVYAIRQEVNTSRFLTAIRVIDKDVPRTDRDWEYFRGQGNPHLRPLRDILMTFAAFHPEVSYAQGMNDILSRFLVVLDDEVEAYWCFTHYLESTQQDFLEDGLLKQLVVVRQLLMEIDVDLCHYLDLLGVGDMTFCHRWMLLSFKREFNEEDSLRCFEILSSHHMELSSMEAEKIRDSERRKDFANQRGKSRLGDVQTNPDFTFGVFMCVAILVDNRDNIFKCTDTSDVFQLVCGLTKKMDLTDLLAKSELLFFKYCCRSVMECFQMVEAPSPAEETPQPSKGRSKSASR